MLSRGKLGAVELVSEYIRNNDMDKVTPSLRSYSIHTLACDLVVLILCVFSQFISSSSSSSLISHVPSSLSFLSPISLLPGLFPVLLSVLLVLLLSLLLQLLLLFHLTVIAFTKAVAILSNLNWNFQPKDCFASLTFIMDHLLIQPLSAKTEGIL